MQVTDDLYAEVHCSANAIVERMKRLLAVFEIPDAELVLYLREDRDAELPPDFPASLQEIPQKPPVPPSAMQKEEMTPDSNPYRTGTGYRFIFNRILQEPKLTHDGLIKWFMENFDKPRPAAEASVKVVVSPKKDISCLSGRGKEIRGNKSAMGHLYYAEKDEKGHWRLFKRIPPLQLLKNN